MHLFLYDMNYQFGWLNHDIQGLRFNGEYFQRRGGVSMGLIFVSYRWLTRIHYRTKGDLILCWWRRRRQKQKLAQMARKCNEERINDKNKLKPLVVICMYHQIHPKKCMPIILSWFVCALLVFRVHDFPVKSGKNLGNVLLTRLCTIF